MTSKTIQVRVARMKIVTKDGREKNRQEPDNGHPLDAGIRSPDITSRCWGTTALCEGELPLAAVIPVMTM